MITRKDLVRQLAKPGIEIVSTFSPSKAHLMHMAVGVVSETIELLNHDSTANALEEIGDALFYAEGLLDVLDHSVADFAEYTKPATMKDVVVLSNEILDLVKKHVVYNAPLNAGKLVQATGEYVTALYAFAHEMGFDDKAIHSHNLFKLSKRYSGLSYSDVAAEKRADKQC